MNPNRWEQLVFLAKEKFGIDNSFTEKFVVCENPEGDKIMGKKEIVEFSAPFGNMRLEKITRPRVVDKKILSNKRIGSKIAVKYIYSDEEPVVELKIYKKNSDSEWEEVNPNTVSV